MAVVLLLSIRELHSSALCFVCLTFFCQVHNLWQWFFNVVHMYVVGIYYLDTFQSVHIAIQLPFKTCLLICGMLHSYFLISKTEILLYGPLVVVFRFLSVGGVG